MKKFKTEFKAIHYKPENKMCGCCPYYAMPGLVCLGCDTNIAIRSKYCLKKEWQKIIDTEGDKANEMIDKKLKELKKEIDDKK